MTKGGRLRGERTPYTLLYTDAACIIRGKAYPKIPLLISRDGTVVVPVTDWLRDQAVVANAPPTTLKTYAEVLQQFWNYHHHWNATRRERARKLGQRIPVDRAWDQIDDDLLAEWRNDQSHGGVNKETINYRLRLVFQFYLWQQENGRVHNLIGTTAWDENGRKRRYPIMAAVVAVREAESGQARAVLSCRLLYGTTSKAGNLHIPTDAEVQQVHVALSNTKSVELATRNTLMVSWAEEVGLRRKEFHALEVSQMPSWEKIEELLEGEGLFELDLTTTKGDKARTVLVPPELLRRTREFIEFEREDLVQKLRERFTGRGKQYNPPDRIFLSERTGAVIALKSITNLVSGAFREADVKAHGHRLRAKYLTEVTEQHFRLAYERSGNAFSRDTILLQVAELAGHARPQTLAPYLNLVVKRHFGTSTSQQIVDDAARDLSRVRSLQEKLRKILAGDALKVDLVQAVGDNAAHRALEVFRQHFASEKLCATRYSIQPNQ